MKQDRRTFMTLAGASAGATLLAGCGASTTAPSPAPPTTPPSSPPDPPPTSPPASPPPTTVSTEMQALQNFLRARASSTLALPATHQNPPTISWAGRLHNAAAATTLPAGKVFPVTSSLIGGPLRNRYAVPPGVQAVLIDNMPCISPIRTYSCKGVPQVTGSPTVLRFRTDAAVIEVTGIVPDGSMTSQTLIVDGALVQPRVLASSTGAGGGWNFGSLRVDFGTRAMREIWLETGLTAAFIRIDAGDTLLPMQDQDEPQITVIGDSYQGSRSTTFCNGQGIALEIGARLGIRKVAVDAIGGTGFWNSNGGLGNLNDRLPAHAADGSAIYLVMAGLNDYADVLNNQALSWPTQATFEQAVLGYLQGLRAAQPKALLVITAPFCPVPSMSDATYVASTTTNGSGQGDFLYKAALFKRSLQQLAAPWVYIDVLMGGGWLNSSGATGDITNLQWFTGGSATPGTTATNKPGNTQGGGGGAYGGINHVPVLSGGRYQQAPDITASGGAGAGLRLASTLDANGSLASINVVTPGYGYSVGTGLPGIAIDPRFELIPAIPGTPVLQTAVNPNGQYPLLAFAPAGVTVAELNNIPMLLSNDTVHPSPLGVSHLSTRLASNLYQAVMAL
jgi:hypothetical protein